MTTIRLATLLGLALFTLGCSSSSRTAECDFQVRKISLETTPSAATVHQINPVDGSRTFLGVTPISDQSVLVIGTIKSYKGDPSFFQYLSNHVEMASVLIEKPGYRPCQTKLSTEREGKTARHKIELQKQ
jgi:hypothetical protein